MKSPDGALSWYEASLPSKERKRRGHFSTPSSLVERILDACGYLPGADLARIRVLDPACGGGNFLAAAARRLLAYSRLRGLDQAAQIALVQRNLWGFDPDPVACLLAEMQLRAAMQEAWWGQARYSQETPLHDHVLQVHQADGLTLPWDPCVDLFVANPPYLAAKNTDLSSYQSTQQRGQADSYLLFLDCALQVVRPGGWIGLVLPDPVLARANAARERAHLLKNTAIYHIWHLAGVFTAEVGAVVIIAQKCPLPPVHRVSWIRGKWQRTSRGQLIAPLIESNTGTVLQSLFLEQPRAELRYLLSNKRGNIAKQLLSYLEEMHPSASRLAPLSEFLSISRGEELGKNSPYITPMDLICRGDPRPAGGPPNDHPGNDHSPTPQPAWYPILRGGIDVRPYRSPLGNWCIPREAIAKPLERYQSPKLIVVKSTDRLQAALDTRGHVTLQTLYLLHLRTKANVGTMGPPLEAGNTLALDDLYFFLALLNSRLLSDYVYVLHTAYKWVQPQIEQNVLARLPVPIVQAEERQKIIDLSKLLVHACSAEDAVVEWKRPISSIYEEQEFAIRMLYASVLPGLFTAAEIHCQD
jgi:SAM-dependent methyltransferase